MIKHNDIYPHYRESVKHMATFGVAVKKTEYVVLTNHDVLGQLLTRMLSSPDQAKNSQLCDNFNLRKAEDLFLKTVPRRSVYGVYKGKRVHVGWACSKKKAQKWFKQNINRMLGVQS